MGINFMICTPHHMLLPSIEGMIILKRTLKVQRQKAAVWIHLSKGGSGGSS